MSALRIQNISKRFGSLQANDDVSLHLETGEVLALLGENGAGKSTLVSILFGHYVADAGSIEVFGKALPPGDPKAALAAGIGIVHQHFALADSLSVLDNILLGTEPLWWLASKRKAAAIRLAGLMDALGLRVEVDTSVGTLSVGEKQRVEILKALYRGARILILDEPTAVLTPQESEALFATVAQLVASGMSVIFISHKLEEVMRVSDRVVVLRGGRLVAQSTTADCTARHLARWMMGEAPASDDAVLAAEEPSPPPSYLGRGRSDTSSSRGLGRPSVVCALHGVHAKLSDREHLRGVDLDLRAGEITAIAGVSGNGQLALASLLCGTLRAHEGSVKLLGTDAPKRASDWVALGVARIPEDRRGTGVVGDLSFWENAVSEHLSDARMSRWGFVRAGAARAQAEAIAQTFDVRGSVRGRDAKLPVARLSGGNMQKLILGRALMRPDGSAPKLVVAHQPTWGLDVGAVAYVQQRLRAARGAGAAVLLISDDLDEILQLADAVAVIHAGHLTGAQPADQWTRESIGLAMAGARAQAPEPQSA